MLLVNQGTHLGCFIERVTYLDALDGWFEVFHELVIDTALNQDSAAGTAVLACIFEDTIGSACSCFLEVCICEHNIGALATQFQGHALDLISGTRHDALAHCGGASEDNLAYGGVGNETFSYDRTLTGQNLE